MVGRDVEPKPFRGFARFERQYHDAFARHALLHLAPQIFGGIASQWQEGFVGGHGRRRAEHEAAFGRSKDYRSRLGRGADDEQQRSGEQKWFHRDAGKGAITFHEVRLFQ